MHLEDHGGRVEVDIELVRCRRLGLGGTVRPPHDGIAEIFQFRVDDDVIRLPGCLKCLFELCIVVGGQHQQRAGFGNLGQEGIERRDTQIDQRIRCQNLTQSLVQCVAGMEGFVIGGDLSQLVALAASREFRVIGQELRQLDAAGQECRRGSIPLGIDRTAGTADVPANDRHYGAIGQCLCDPVVGWWHLAAIGCFAAFKSR